MFRTVSPSIIRSFSLYTHYRFADSLRAGSGRNWSSSQAVSKTCMTYPIAVCTVKNSRWWTEKHVEFYSKNKFEELVHLFGFIIIIYHDARSSERQICKIVVCKCTIFKLSAYVLHRVWRTLHTLQCIHWNSRYRRTIDHPSDAGGCSYFVLRIIRNSKSCIVVIITSMR